MNILVVAAHPDDEILGCGGVMAMLAPDNDIYTYILSPGRLGSENFENSVDANKAVGVSKVYRNYFPDNKFDSVPLLDIVNAVENVVFDLKPEIVFTHSKTDLNIDHCITHRAVLTATRPIRGCKVREVYAFEVLSSTEWSYPAEFSPNIFWEIDIEPKLKALEYYKSEMRADTPRNPETVKENARLWGAKVGVKYAEAFECVRILR